MNLNYTSRPKKLHTNYKTESFLTRFSYDCYQIELHRFLAGDKTCPLRPSLIDHCHLVGVPCDRFSRRSKFETMDSLIKCAASRRVKQRLRFLSALQVQLLCHKSVLISSNFSEGCH